MNILRVTGHVATLALIVCAVLSVVACPSSGAAPSDRRVAPPVVGENHPPEFGLTGLPAATAQENVAYSWTVNATDPDGDSLTYLLLAPTATATGMVLNGGVIQWTPPVGSAGAHVVSVVASDSVAAVNLDWTITVEQAVVAPSFTNSAPPATVVVNQPYSWQFVATGYPAPTISALIPAAGSWLTFDTTTNTLWGTPVAVGTVSGIQLVATNGTFPDATSIFDINVAAAPVAPSFTSAVPVATAPVGQLYTHTFTADGLPEPDITVDFTVSGLPYIGWLSFNPLNDTIDGTPLPGDAGTSIDIDVTASNGTAPDATYSFTIDVPVIAPTINGFFGNTAEAADAFVNQTSTYNIATTGAPAPQITISGCPGWFAPSPLNTYITGAPQDGDVNTTSTITIIASNAAGQAERELTVTVRGIAPLFTNAAPAVATAGQPYSYVMTASGAPAPTFTVSDLSGVPGGWLHFDGTNTLSGSPEAADVGGTGSITITASNVAGDVTQTFEISVSLPPAWTIESLGSGGESGDTAIATQDDGTVHLAYYDASASGLKYVTRDTAGTWSVPESIESGDSSGVLVSMALDSQNCVHLAYYRMGQSVFHYATNASGSWATPAVITGQAAGYVSIAVDGADQPHVACTCSYISGGVSRHQLKYATPDMQGVWQVQAVTAAGGAYSGDYASLALDSLGQPHIAYKDKDSDLFMHAWSTGSWNFEVIDSAGSDAGAGISLKIDGDDHAHVAFNDAHGVVQNVYYATNTSGRWACQRVDTVDSLWLPVLVLDSSDFAHVIYSGETEEDLRYAHNVLGNWVIETVDDTDAVGMYAAAALDADDHIRIAYRDRANDCVKYAQRNNDLSGATLPPVITTDAPTGVTIGLAAYEYRIRATGASPLTIQVANLPNSGWLTFDGIDTLNGTPQVTEVPQTITITITNALGLTATQEFEVEIHSGWQLEMLDSTGNTGQRPSVSIDTNGVMHVAYYNSTGKQLMYINNAAGVWSTPEVVDQAVGANASIGTPSLVADSSGNIHFAYVISYALMYAVGTPSLWSIEQIAVSGTALRAAWSALAVHTDGTVNVLYGTTDRRECRLAKGAFGNWPASTRAGSANENMSGCIALDSAGKAHVCYDSYQQSTRRMYYVNNTSANGIWSAPYLAADVATMYYSIAIDSGSTAHIAYYSPSYDLHYRTRSIIGGWTDPVIVDDSGSHTGAHITICLDGSGKAHLAYHDSDQYMVKYATNATGPWVCEAVGYYHYAASIPAGKHVAMAVDRNSIAHIMYYDYASQDISYARQN